MPALMIAIRKNKDGSVERVTTPFDDYGSGSVGADLERVRLEKEGFTVKILREKELKEMEARGQSVWKPD